MNTILTANPVAPASNAPYSFGPRRKKVKGKLIKMKLRPILLKVFVLAVAKKKPHSSDRRFGESDKST